MCSITKQLDSYSMLIVSKYFIHKQDYINTICVCKKFKETTEKLRFNPISITSLKLFPKIQTQYLYDQNDKKLDIIEHQEIWYEVNYEEYLKYKENNIKCHHITYTSENRKKCGDTIPDEVTKLKGDCFQNSEITTVLIPNTITSLGSYCFDECSDLKSVNLPMSLTNLNEYCFSGCTSLTSINIPTSIQFIDNFCFECCSNLTTIGIPNSVTSIGYYCFDYCELLETIKLPSTLSLLEDGTFRNCSSLTNIKLPTTLISIGYSCFENCISLSTILLPLSIQHIQLGCFNGCINLTRIDNADQLNINMDWILNNQN